MRTVVIRAMSASRSAAASGLRLARSFSSDQRMPLRDLSVRCSMRRILSTAALACQTTWNLSNVMRALGSCSVQPLMKAGDMSMLTRVDLLGRAAVGVELGRQFADRLGIAALGDEQDPTREGIGRQGDVVVAAGTRGLVDGKGLDVAEVGLRQRQFDVALADRQHPIGRLARDARDGGKRHLLRQHQDQRFEQQREARQPACELRLDQAHRAIGQLHARRAHAKMALVLEEVQMPVGPWSRCRAPDASPSSPDTPKRVPGAKSINTVSRLAAASNSTDFTDHGAPMPSADSKSLSCITLPCSSGRMRQHAAFGPTAAYRRPVGVKGSLRRATPALDPAQTPNTPSRYPLEIQERLL